MSMPFDFDLSKGTSCVINRNPPMGDFLIIKFYLAAYFICSITILPCKTAKLNNTAISSVGGLLILNAKSEVKFVFPPSVY